MSREKEILYLPCIFGSRDLVGKIIMKIILNTMAQIRDKTAYFFFPLGFLSREFTIHSKAREWGG